MRFDDVADEFVAAIPGSAQDVVDLRAWWQEANPPTTIVMGTFGKVYVREAERLSESAKRRFFAIVEKALHDGGDSIQAAVATGLLEAAVSAVERAQGDRSKVIDTYSGPLARQYMEAWDEFSLRDNGGAG